MPERRSIVSTLTLELSDDLLADLELSGRRLGRTAAEEARARLEQEARQRAQVDMELEELQRFRESLKMGDLTDERLFEARKVGRR